MLDQTSFGIGCKMSVQNFIENWKHYRPLLTIRCDALKQYLNNAD